MWTSKPLFVLKLVKHYFAFVHYNLAKRAKIVESLKTIACGQIEKISLEHFSKNISWFVALCSEIRIETKSQTQFIIFHDTSCKTMSALIKQLI